MKKWIVALLFIACWLCGYVASVDSTNIGSSDNVGTYQAACARTGGSLGECIVIDTRTGRIVAQYRSNVLKAGFKRSDAQEVP